MHSDLEENLSERFVEYQYLRTEHAYHDAFKRLAEIYHCLPKLNKAERGKWAERLRKEVSSGENIKDLNAGITDDVQRIRQILAYGTRWNDDEILLVLTLRIQIDLAMAFFNEHTSHEVTVATEDIDDKIVRISKTKDSQRSFDIAIRLIKKNWGLPINSRWLEIT